MNAKILTKSILGTTFAAALALSAAQPTLALPVLSNTESVKAAATNQATEVHWRTGPAFAAGAIAGLALGAAAASANSYYYAPAPVYNYGPAYGYAPYYGPAHGYAPYYGGGYGYGYAPYNGYGPYYGDSRGYYRGRVDTNAGGSW